jgi:ribonuclease-3
MSTVHAPAGPAALGELLDELPAELRLLVFTHASWAEQRHDSYERLAFLGDSVLGLAVSTHLYPRFADAGAGKLTKVRAQAVAGPACARVAAQLGLPERLAAAAPSRGTGKSSDTLTGSERVLASICEAVIGAAYVAHGYERVAPAVVAAFAEEIEEALSHPVDHKSDLQELLARTGAIVTYRIDAEDGPPHDRRFVAVAVARAEEVGRGEGRSKKNAEQEAARHALERLGVPS